MMAARDEAGGGTGSARRRRERRLRAYLRYARMSVAMALAESQHRSAQRQRKVRAREDDREVHYTAAFRATDPRAGALRPLRGARRGAAQLAVGAAMAAGTSAAAHRGARWCHLPFCADSRCSSSADGGPGAETVLCTGPWSSTGPVFGMVLSARCCATTDAVADSARGCLVRQWIFSASLLGGLWKNFTYFLREGGTQILKSTLRPALHSRSGEVCTVDASIAEQLHLEIWTVFPMKPLYSTDFFQRSAHSAS